MMFSRKPLTIAIRKPKPELSANQVNRQTRPRSAQPRRTRSSPWSFSIALRFSASIQPAFCQARAAMRTSRARSPRIIAPFMRPAPCPA